MDTTTTDTGADDASDGTPEILDEDDPSGPIGVDETQTALAGKAPETVNLVSSIDPDEKEKIGNTTLEEFEADWKDSEKYRTKRAELYKLCFGILPAKDDGYAQIHYGIMLKAVIRLQARVYDQEFPSNGEYWGCRPTSAADLDRTVRVSKHMNWQTLHQIPEYVPNHDSMIFQWYINGDALSFMYWSPTKNRPCHEWLPTDDYVLPYAYPQQASDPSLSGLPRITRIVRKHRFGPDGLDALAASGYYDQAAVDSLFDEAENRNPTSGGGSMEQAASPIRQAVDRASGVEKPPTEKGLRVLLEQHRWWKLPAWSEYRPVIVTIDRDTKKLLGFVLREDEDPEDRARYNREKLANDASYQAAMAQYEADLQRYMTGLMAMGAPNMTQPPAPGMATMGGPPEPGPTTSTPPPIPGAAGMSAPPAPGEMTPTIPGMTPKPEPPIPPPLPAPPKMVPIHFFTHYVCIPNPEGIYGYGIGYLLEGNNLTADALGSAIVTSGLLATTGTGIRSREAKLRGGEFKVKPGEFVEVDCLPSELAQVLHQIKYPPPDPNLGKIIEAQQADAQEVSGAGDILSGEVGGSNETATTTQIRISQALAAISIQDKRYRRGRTNEGKILARLNSVYLPDSEYFVVIDPYHRMPPVESQIGRADYLEDTAITVTADPRMASQPQRFQEAMQAVSVFAQLAPMAPWLQTNQALISALISNVWTAMDRPDLVAMSQPPPPPPPGMEQPGPAGLPQPGQAAPPPGARSPGASGAPPPNGGPPGVRAGQPRPNPAPPGPRVPNGGPIPANSGPMAQ